MDVHRDTIVTTIRAEGGKETRRSGVSSEELRKLMEWLKGKNCLKGVMEGSGVYMSLTTSMPTIRSMSRFLA